jgi:hypothetical protein
MVLTRLSRTEGPVPDTNAASPSDGQYNCRKPAHNYILFYETCTSCAAEQRRVRIIYCKGIVDIDEGCH